MDRRTLIVSGLVSLGTAGLAKAELIQLPPAQLPPARPRDDGPQLRDDGEVADLG